jgi:putative transposase
MIAASPGASGTPDFSLPNPARISAGRTDAVGHEPPLSLPYAETQAACEALREKFTTRYQKLAPKAVERLADDWERLVTFYQFPREHWVHLRTTNIVESPFATVRLRTTAAKRFKKMEHATALIWKILQVAESTFRRLKGAELLPAVYAGAQDVDGVLKMRMQQQIAA